MDNTTLIIGIVVLLICLLPILLVYLSRKRDEKKVYLQLTNIAASKNCSVDIYDLWNNRAVGIDTQKHILFYLSQTNNEVVEREIYLKDIVKSRVINIKSNYSEKGEKDAVGRLELGLTYLNKKIPESFIEFYSTNHDNLTLNGELELVEKWDAIVRKELAAINL